MLESSFNRLASFKTCNFLKKKLQHRCFLVNIAQFLRALILMKICEQLLLQFLFFTSYFISSLELVSTLNLIGVLQRSSSRFKEFSLGCLVVGSSLIWKKEKLAEITTRCHSLSFIVTCCTTRCYSLSLVVIRCTTCYHSLSFVVIRCHLLYHSLSLVVPLVVTCCHSMYHSSVFL